MKKLFPDEKGHKKGFMDFLDKKGFYIVLLLCIAIVGGIAVYVTTRNAASDLDRLGAENIITDDMGDDSADAGAGLNAQEPIDTAAAINDDKLALEDTVDTAKTTTPQDKEAKPAASPKPKASTGTSSIHTTKSSGTDSKATSGSEAAVESDFIMPVFGEVTFEYAKDRLVYSRTLEEWRTHDGLDLASDRGTPVKAVSDGVVSEIKNDPRYGVVVIIDHDDGLKTVYSNLASDDMVTSNQKVKQGDVIGSVGDTAIFESAEASHLHFEVLVDNVSQDPLAYLPQEQVTEE